MIMRISMPNRFRLKKVMGFRTMKNQIQTVMRIAKQLGKELQTVLVNRTLTIGQRILELTLLISVVQTGQQHSRRRQSVYL